MTPTPVASLELIDEHIIASDPARQDVLIAMAHGQLTRDELRAFAAQYFHLVDALPRFVSTVHSVTADPTVRRVLINVLVPLELKPPSVAELWLQTCAALGLFSDSVRSGEPTTSTAACLGDFEYLCQAGTVQGLAALYAWMRRLPVVCRTEKRALAEHYHLDSGPGIQFFDVVSLQAESHARALRDALARMIDRTPEAAADAVDAARAAIVAVEGLYRGALAPTH